MLTRLRRSAEDHDGGFTLVELLVVVIIIGILAAIAIPVFLHQRQKGYDVAAKSDLHQLATNEETYYVDHGRYGSAADLHGAGLDVTASKGDAVLVYLSKDDGFCLGSTNQAGDPSSIQAGTGVIYWYDNAGGGLQKTETGFCPSFPPGTGTAMNGLWTNNWNGLNGYVSL